MTDGEYNLVQYGRMIACEARMAAYARAIELVVKPGDIVFDIGAGPGVFAILAAQRGARKVVAIEPASSVNLAPALAQANGVGDRVEVFQGLSTDYQPAERADVIVSDLRSRLPYFGGHFAAIDDARTRLLRPGGTLIPQRDRVFAAMVESPEVHADYDRPWRSNHLGLDLGAGAAIAGSRVGMARLPKSALLTEATELAELDYRAPVEAGLDHQFVARAAKAGTAHAIALWFDGELADGIGFSNAPASVSMVYGQTLLPLPEPVKLAIGDESWIRVAITPLADDYIYSWQGRFGRADGSVLEFARTSGLSEPLSPQGLAARNTRSVPRASREAMIDALCLANFDGRQAIEDIAMRLRNAYPGDFADDQSAIDHVAGLASRYDRKI